MDAPSQNTASSHRVVIYYQTHHYHDNTVISLLPHITSRKATPSAPTSLHRSYSSITHVILAAIHLNEPSSRAILTLNDDPPETPRNKDLWLDLRILQSHGIKVMGMLGGAARGTYRRLDGTGESFEMYYAHLHKFIAEHHLEGLDLDVEEEMSLEGIIRLIDRLKDDFGKSFIITLAPVSPALRGKGNLSGFSYQELEKRRGDSISWYNAQFYCGWGDMSDTKAYEAIIKQGGWDPNKVVAGVVTNSRNGRGYVDMSVLQGVLAKLVKKYPTFGGVMGWEYFNSLPGDADEPWHWAALISQALEGGFIPPPTKRLTLWGFLSSYVFGVLNTMLSLARMGKHMLLSISHTHE
jgi:Glycosyl hydrolases family 18